MLQLIKYCLYSEILKVSVHIHSGYIAMLYIKTPIHASELCCICRSSLTIPQLEVVPKLLLSAALGFGLVQVSRHVFWLNQMRMARHFNSGSEFDPYFTTWICMI